MTTKYEIIVLTGDQFGAGTDANVKIILVDKEGNKSPTFDLRESLKNNFERSSEDKFNVAVPKDSLSNISKIDIWKDKAGSFSDWFLKGVNVLNISKGDKFTFPVFKWIDSGQHYVVCEFDTSLPQEDENNVSRSEYLNKKRTQYEYKQNVPGLPVRIKNVPEEEKFSWHYSWDIVKQKLTLKWYTTLKNFFSPKWTTIDQMTLLYDGDFLPEPESMKRWDCNYYFGLQRTGGCSIELISLCNSIPDKLGVTNEMLAPLLDGLSIEDAINAKRLFITDLEILQGMFTRKGHVVCSPIALFFENFDNKLVPVAIQLQQEKGPDNPVFLASDPRYTWIMAKIWYNNADAVYHQSCSHLAFTHLLMEGVWIAANRQLSTSHPIYKLLAPHFLYLIAINALAVNKLISPGGLFDKAFSCGREGMFDTMRKGLERWHVNVNGTLPTFLKRRGVMDSPKNFPFRDDALLIYEVIKRYVTKIVHLYYCDSRDKLLHDWELQSWAAELTRDKDKGGVGLKGVPGNGFFNSVDDLVTVLTSFIYTCSVGHAATNFPQYDIYGYPPNCATQLFGKPPTTKKELTERDILNVLPYKGISHQMVIAAKVLSARGTKPLGDFEVCYTFDPPAKTIIHGFRQDLLSAAKIIDERNKVRDLPYTVLCPDQIPNSISI